MTETYLIPMDVVSSAYFTQTANLSGQAFSFRFLFNERDGFFYMDVETNEGKREGVRMVPNSPLLGQSGVTTLGDFYLLSSNAEADQDNIKYEDYGNVWNLYWIPFDQEDEEE